MRDAFRAVGRQHPVHIVSITCAEPVRTVLHCMSIMDAPVLFLLTFLQITTSLDNK
jgi:hypothetical protein